MLSKLSGLLRCGKSCRLRWINYLRPDLKRGNFAEDEEDLIIKLHALLGNRCISSLSILILSFLADFMHGLSYILLFIFTCMLMFIRWSLIAGRLPGRTDNEVKNYWNSHLRRKLVNMGIDPNNHRLNRNFPRLQNPQGSFSATSSELKSDTTKTRHDNNNNNNEQASDAASCLEDSPIALPDLNLDLTMSIPSSRSFNISPEAKQKITESNLSKEPEFAASSPTLLLFQ